MAGGPSGLKMDNLKSNIVTDMGKNMDIGLSGITTAYQRLKAVMPTEKKMASGLIGIAMVKKKKLLITMMDGGMVNLRNGI